MSQARQASTMRAAVADDASPARPPLTVSVAQAARLLGVGESAIRGAVARGELEAVRIGKLIRIKRAPLLEKLELPDDYEIE